MNARQRRTLTRALARDGITAKPRRSGWIDLPTWAPFVDGHRVDIDTAHGSVPAHFYTRIAALRFAAVRALESR